MKLNTAVKGSPITNNEGAPAVRQNSTQLLRRSVMACLLWEDSFYEDGQSIAERIKTLVPLVPAEQVAAMAVEAREQMKLRHIPLFLCSVMAALPSHKLRVADTLSRVIQRADELAEFLAIHQQLNPGKSLKKTLSAQIKHGLAQAFTKFDAYALGKYNRDSAIKLRDVLFLCHAKPEDAARAALWKRLIDGTIPTPDTWEVALSSGANKKDAWSRLLSENKLGALAILRNLRNMTQAGIDKTAIKKALETMKVERVLPFRFIAAARIVPGLEDVIEPAMFRCLAGAEKMVGKTLLLIDNSPSMTAKLSSKSDMNRRDGAFALAVLLREICEEVEIVSFSTQAAVVPPRRGFALADAISRAVQSNGTLLGGAIRAVSGRYDRLIVVTDEESQDSVGSPDKDKPAYMVNVSSEKNAVGHGAWTRITGWSESIVRFIQENERPVHD